jgi:hypothetical protein
MALNLKSFMRRVPAEVMREFAIARHPAFARIVDWADPNRATPEELFNAILGIPGRDHDAICRDLENVELLCDPVGQIALFSVIRPKSDIVSRLSAVHSNEARSIGLLLADDLLFEHALAAVSSDRLRNGRSWSAYVLDKITPASCARPRPLAFQDEIAKALAHPDGTIGKLKVDTFVRQMDGFDGRPATRIAHYAIYNECMPINSMEFDVASEQVIRQTKRPVSEGAVLYDEVGRTIEVTVAGGKTARRRIAESFAENMLGLKRQIRPIALRRFMLECLRERMPFDADPADGIRSVSLILLQLSHWGEHVGQLTIQSDPADRMDIWERSRRWFGDRDPLHWREWSVSQAVLRIQFHAEEGKRRGRTISIRLRQPNISDIRDLTQQHQMISQKYLAKWGLLATSD